MKTESVVVIKLVEKLVNIGIKRSKAEELVKKHGTRFIENKITMLEKLLKQPKDSAAWLVDSIQNDYQRRQEPRREAVERPHSTVDETSAMLRELETKMKKPRSPEIKQAHIKIIKDVLPRISKNLGDTSR